MEFKPFFKTNDDEIFVDTKPNKKKSAHPFLNSKSTIVPKNFSDPFESLLSETSNVFDHKTFSFEKSKTSFTSKAKSKSGPKTPKQLSIISALGIFLAIVCLSSLILTVLDQSQLISEKRFAYLEFKIMSPNGNVSPGADVYINGEKMGISDSFGEWRRFVRVGLGNELKIDISKGNTYPPLKAHKIMNIPNELNAHEELEIKSTIRLAKSPKPSTRG